MKKIVIFLMVFYYSTSGQEVHQAGDAHYELFIGTRNCTGETNVFTATSQTSVRWNEDYQITSSWASGTNDITLEGNTNPNDNDVWRHGYDFLRYSGQTFANSQYGGILGYSKYKIKNETSNKYFYIDYMDCRYWGSNRPPEFPYLIDIFILYDNETFKYLNIDKTSFDAISNGETITVWEDVFELNGHENDCYELYLTVTNQNGYPHLSWNPYPETVNGYYVNRKLTTTSSGTRTDQYFTTSTSWTDDDFYLNDRYHKDDIVEYWITAKLSPTQESLEGNHVTKRGDSLIEWKKGNDEENKEFVFNLEQNYPNPFNPSTVISFQIPEESFVDLRVFDMLGREVAELVNNNLIEGKYDVNFNAESLPSGIYFYRVKTDKYNAVKKMFLIK